MPQEKVSNSFASKSVVKTSRRHREVKFELFAARLTETSPSKALREFNHMSLKVHQ